MSQLNNCKWWRRWHDITSWQIYFGIQYYLGFSPFRISIDHSTGKFIQKTFWPQTIFCFLADLCMMPWIIRELRQSIPTDRANPSLYLSTFLAITSVPMMLLIKSKLWLGRKSLLEIVNKFASLPIEITGRVDRIICSKYVILLIILFWGIIGITTWTMGRGLWSGKAWTLELWWSKIMEAGYYNLFLKESQEDPGNLFVGIISALGFFQWYNIILFVNTHFSKILLCFTCPTFQENNESWFQSLYPDACHINVDASKIFRDLY